MEIKELKCWEDFEKEIKDLFSYVKSLKEKSEVSISTPLFRGQSNSDWGLKTTLDRIKSNVSMSSYHNIMRRIKSEVESYTNRHWEIPKFKEPDKNFWVAFAPEEYTFMIYLRHHNFPSPLLDWTRSPYIAAFFAFAELQLGENVAIFAYIEDVGEGKSGAGDEPIISPQGPNITTHKRHHRQQCEYTICTKELDKKIYYCDHEDVFNKADPEQDLLKKYILPSSDKIKALEELDLMNINAYSLFDTDESLMHTLTIREFFIEK